MPLTEKLQNTITYYEWLEDITADVPAFDPTEFVPGLDGPSSAESPVHTNGTSSDNGTGNNTSADVSSISTTTTIISSETQDVTENASNDPPEGKADNDDPPEGEVDNDAANTRDPRADIDNLSEASAWSMTPSQPGWGNYARRTTGDDDNDTSRADSDSSEFDFLVPDVQAHREVLDKYVYHCSLDQKKNISFLF